MVELLVDFSGVSCYYVLLRRDHSTILLGVLQMSVVATYLHDVERVRVFCGLCIGNGVRRICFGHDGELAVSRVGPALRNIVSHLNVISLEVDGGASWVHGDATLDVTGAAKLRANL